MWHMLKVYVLVDLSLPTQKTYKFQLLICKISLGYSVHLNKNLEISSLFWKVSYM